VTCSVSALSNHGDMVTGKVRLIDSSHNAVTNATGSGINVSYALGGQGGGLAPSSPQSIANGSSATPDISLQMNNGNNKTAMLTASVTVNGTTYTVMLTASS
jgi:hypothetical protein